MSREEDMGQAESLCPVQRAIDSDTWYDIVVDGKDANYCTAIKLDGGQVANNPFQHKYIIKLLFWVPKEPNATLLFPRLKKNRVMPIRGEIKSSDVARDLNARLDQSGRDGVSLVVAYNSHFYCMTGITGTVYLIWAERIHQQTVNQMEPQTMENVPLIIEMNRERTLRNVYVIGHEQPLPMADVTLLTPTLDGDIFCCELDPRVDQKLSISTISSVEADRITTDPIGPAIRMLKDEEDPPFADDIE